MAVFRNLKAKLLILILPLCLVPLLTISTYSYFLAKQRITEDRVVLYLKQISRGVADTIHLTLVEEKEDTIAMAFASELRSFLTGGPKAPAQETLNRFMLVHEVYDLLILFDVEGRSLLVSDVDRRKAEYVEFPSEPLQSLLGVSLRDEVPGDWLPQVRASRFGFVDWHYSELVNTVYDYEEDDIALRYNIGFASPVTDERGVVVGGILALMNWRFIQDVLDRVEEQLQLQALKSGYAFLFGSDENTIIGHRLRLNRVDLLSASDTGATFNNYGTRLVEEHRLVGLQKTVSAGGTEFEYQYPVGVEKISGLASVDHEFFRWTCGVGINNEEIFGPVDDLKNTLIVAVVFSAALIVFLTYSLARQISIPLKELTVGARRVSGGDYSERVAVTSHDEIGELANTFNDMAASLEERSRALLELTKSLEAKVDERTRELRKSNRKTKAAYHDLQEAQVQLVQSEKMASLGQLVAGIAHEIKNPLNFIYGNTDFLRQYIHDLKSVLSILQEKAVLDEEALKSLEQFKEEINYDFLLDDIETLINNFEEGAKRIHAIIGDLRTFSRLDTDQLKPVDVHEPIDLALNLLSNQYRDRIRIHKEYSKLPPVECDPGKISQVFMNLLVNACHAIADTGDIWIRTSPQNGVVKIEIEDTGEGISKEHLGKVFEPFFTTKPVGKGTGLGLSISYGIIKQHKGTIQIVSQPGGGTCFTVELPIKP